MLAIVLLVFGIFMRVVVHTPNFTPVIAIALFSGVYLKKKHALILPVALMAITDLILGAHRVMLFTWGSVLLIAAIGLWLRQNKTTTHTLTSSLASAFLFFIITNFGVWLAGYYPQTLEGLQSCYVMAIPFFRTMLVSTLVYTFVFFGAYELIARAVRNTKFASYVL
ncbi:MAG TPA: hypothetical protein PKH98_00220 [Candidatus Omnitrophota bacterium]|nr:hypothetical protein [Candidatus Omnitrophota bacterium]